LIQTIRDNALEVCKRNKLKGKVPTKKSIGGVRLDKRCFSLRGNQLTLIGSNKRTKCILHVADYYKEIFETWEYRSATLNFDKKKKQFWINISFKKELPLKINTPAKSLGIDRGLYNIVALSNGIIIPVNKIRSIRRKNLYNKSVLQQKGTPSAKRKLRKISGKEKRFMKDTNHCLTKRIVNMDYDTFVLEKLSGIRHKRRGKKMNKWLSN
jgi:putative transposase